MPDKVRRTYIGGASVSTFKEIVLISGNLGVDKDGFKEMVNLRKSKEITRNSEVIQGYIIYDIRLQ